MLWLLAQVWLWTVVAFLFGVGVGWVFWARPVRRRVDELVHAHASGHTATG